MSNGTDMTNDPIPGLIPHSSTGDENCCGILHWQTEAKENAVCNECGKRVEWSVIMDFLSDCNEMNRLRIKHLKDTGEDKVIPWDDAKKGLLGDE